EWSEHWRTGASGTAPRKRTYVLHDDCPPYRRAYERVKRLTAPCPVKPATWGAPSADTVVIARPRQAARPPGPACLGSELAVGPV
ncbi:hypothetical protein Q604_UNBC06571G0001, partial [human gut metagenome]